MSNIKNNNYRKYSCRLVKDKYLDFMLSKDNVQSTISSNDLNTITLDLSQIQGNHVTSKTIWNDAVSSITVLKNIGYTGVDNGFISYERDRIGNDEFLNLFTKSNFNLYTFYKKLFLTKVTGNTQMLVYPIENHDEYTSFKGGFYQGFFKIDGDVYQTLPHRIENEWNFNFTLRTQDYETPSNILNKRHEDNSGIFFYIGTRAENKFWELYKKDPAMETYKEDETDDYYLDYDVMDADVIRHQYLSEEHDEETSFETASLTIEENINNTESETKTIEINSNEEEYNSYFADDDYISYDYFDFSSSDSEDTYLIDDSITFNDIDVNYFADDYFNLPENENSETIEINNEEEKVADYIISDNTIESNTVLIEDNYDSDSPIFDDDYLLEQIDLSMIDLIDTKGRPIGETGFYEIKTDNKFIIFNRTKNGFTKDSWNDDNEYFITGKSINSNVNYFIHLNRTKDGYNKNNINELSEKESEPYNVLKDIENNAFALKINKDGSISYRYLSTDCELIEETSKPNIVPKNEWCNIHLKIERITNSTTDECNEFYKPGLMRLYIYINGYLKLISKELPELMLKPLNDTPEKQEMVPYCISIGGGSQGLAERVLIDYYDRTDYILPIEKYFAGTFIGDIKNFNFTPSHIDFSVISQIRKRF